MRVVNASAWLGIRGLCLLVLAWMSACAQLPAWMGGGQATPEPSGSLLFADDFSQAPGSWGVSQLPEAAAAYERGGLRLLVAMAGKSVWSVAGQHFADAAVSASAERLSGPRDNMIGLICRYQDRDDYYLGIVSSDGYYGIARIEAGVFDLISAQRLQYNGDLAGREGSLELTLVCSGRDLILAVDRVVLTQAQDGTFADGDVGVFAGAYQEPGVDILFDDFMVRQP
jgi:hypothetical protein